MFMYVTSIRLILNYSSIEKVRENWRTISMESGESERPSSRARERARSRTLKAWAASCDASFPFMADSTNPSAFTIISLFPIAYFSSIFSLSPPEGFRHHRLGGREVCDQTANYRLIKKKKKKLLITVSC